jgi:azurin
VSSVGIASALDTLLLCSCRLVHPSDKNLMPAVVLTTGQRDKSVLSEGRTMEGQTENGLHTAGRGRLDSELVKHDSRHRVVGRTSLIGSQAFSR